MSTAASLYADYESACPRCQQIINTIDITFQQGIFIYDLTYIQQELESVLVAALQRQNQLLNYDGQILKLPSSSLVRLSNGKTPHDLKIERERRRKALAGQMSRKRRIRKSSKRNVFNRIKSCDRFQNGFHPKSNKNLFNRTDSSSDNIDNSKRLTRSYRPTYPYHYETNHRKGNGNDSTINKMLLDKIPYPDHFWRKLVSHENDFTDSNSIEKLIEIDQSLINDCHNEDEYNRYKNVINSTEYLLANEKYSHSELEYSISIKQNQHLHNLVDNIINNNQNITNNRLKRKHSSTLNEPNSYTIDKMILKFIQREETTFPSKHAELQYRLNESLSLEHLALDRAKKQYEINRMLDELNDIDNKIFEITNSIRFRKRPSDSSISSCKSTNSNDTNPNQNGIHDSDAWRKAPRQSTLRMYDQLANLVDQRINFENKLTNIDLSSRL